MMYSESVATLNMDSTEPKESHKRDISENYALKSIQDYSRAIHSFPANYVLYLYRGRILLRIG